MENINQSLNKPLKLILVLFIPKITATTLTTNNQCSKRVNVKFLCSPLTRHLCFSWVSCKDVIDICFLKFLERMYNMLQSYLCWYHRLKQTVNEKKYFQIQNRLFYTTKSAKKNKMRTSNTLEGWIATEYIVWHEY